MALPSVSISINPNGLRQVPASAAGVCAKLGICSGGLVNTLYSVGDPSVAQTSLGAGPLVENVVDGLGASAQVLAMPLNPSTAGTLGAVTHTGPGTGTVVPSSAPAYTIDIKISTGGALGTMAIQYRINGGGYSNPVVSVAGGTWVYLVPGTLTTLTFSSQTYTVAAVWTFATTGGVSLAGGGTAGWVTQASSPLDGYAVVITIVNPGALGAATFTYSLDGGVNTSGQVLVPGGGIYAIPGSGVVLTFAGTFTAADGYTFTTTTATFTTGDVTAAFAVLMADPTEWGFVHVVGAGANAAAAAAMAAVIDTTMVAAEVAYRYVFGVVESPTSESDATVAAAFSTFVSARTMVCAGDIAHISPISNRVIRRNCATVVTSRLALIPISEHPGFVGRGSLQNVKSLYRDEFKTPYLDAQRFTTLRTIVGQQGFFVTRGNMMAQDGTDYTNVMNRRVMDTACKASYRSLIQFLNASLPVNRATGFIFDPFAAQMEAIVDNDVSQALGANASGVNVAISRTENILSTHRLPVSIGVIPLGYAEQIVETIGLVNPALAA